MAHAMSFARKLAFTTHGRHVKRAIGVRYHVWVDKGLKNKVKKTHNQFVLTFVRKSVGSHFPGSIEPKRVGAYSGRLGD